MKIEVTMRDTPYGMFVPAIKVFISFDELLGVDELILEFSLRIIPNALEYFDISGNLLLLFDESTVLPAYRSLVCLLVDLLLDTGFICSAVLIRASSRTSVAKLSDPFLESIQILQAFSHF